MPTGLSYAQVEEILRILEEFPATEIRFEYQDLKLHVRRTGGNGQMPVEGTAAQAKEPNSPSGSSVAAPQGVLAQTKPRAKDKAKKPRPAELKGLTPVVSPMMGVFYRAPAPGAEPFVKVGQKVSPGTDLCIIEVMKVMNLLKAPCAGVVVEIDAENGSMVELDQPLMWIKP